MIAIRLDLLKVCAPVLLSVTFAGWAFADTIEPPPLKDNTLIQTPNTNSNGAGPEFYAGKTSTMGVRRGLLAFNLSGIPAGSTINTVTLTLNMSQTIVGAMAIDLHRCLADWGEGTSIGGGGGAAATTGDATWVYRFYNTATWATQGGVFSATASGTQSVAGDGLYSWSSAGMAADVQFWVNNPSQNFGWLIQGPEGGGVSTKAFDSKEGPVPPKLEVDYTPSSAGVPAGLGAQGVEFSSPWPVPARDAVNLGFALPRAARVSLSIHDANGRLVRHLVADQESAGPHAIVWDRRTEKGVRAAAGVYMARLVVDGTSYQRRVPLLP